MANPIPKIIPEPFDQNQYLHQIMNNPYVSFIICSLIKLIIYVLIYKLYIILKKLYTTKYTDSN